MKVLHLIQRYPPAVGGSETWCREVCQYLAAAGDLVKVLTLDVVEEEEFWRDPPAEQCIIRLGRLEWDHGVLVRRYRRSLPVHSLYHSVLKVVLDRWLGIYFYGPHSIEMYGRLLSEVRAADVVNLHTVPYPHNLLGYLAARLCGKPVVITPHFHPGHPHYERRSHYWLLKRCDTVVVVSEYERDYLEAKGVEASRIVTTGNGVHLDEYCPTDLASFSAGLRAAHGLTGHTRPIVFLGRKLEYKGIATLVEAFRRLPRHLDAALFLAGPSSPWFDDFYRDLPATDRARIIDLGVVSHQDKVHLLHLAHALVLPSRFEAFGIVILEAWACGIPVIVSATGAMPSIVGDGGVIFEHGNAADLAAKMEQLLEDTDRARAMAQRGQQRLRERYTWDRIAAAARTAYRPRGAAGRRLRVLICSNLFPPYTSGGAEIVAHREAVTLTDLGVDVHVFCGRLDGTPDHRYGIKSANGELRKTWISLSRADMSGEWWNFHNDAVRRQFAAVLDRVAPDVVHFHNLVGLSVGMIDECATRKIPTVLTLHDYWGICFKNTMLKNDGALCTRGGFDCLGCKTALWGESSIPSPVRNAHIALSLAKVDRFISPSHYLADRYAANGISRDRILVMRNGIDLERFDTARPERDTFTVGFIGYLNRHKGLDVLLRALSLLPGSNDVRLLVAGDGEERETLHALCRALRLGRLVTFLGHVDNRRIGSIYGRIDALVVPSVWPENSPVTITEAMASGIPVIASDVGGVRELVEDGVTGLLSPPRDARALAERIERLRAEPALRRTMGRNARARIAGDGLRAQVTRLVQIFEELSPQTRIASAPGFEIVLYASAGQHERPVLDMLHQLARLETTLQTRFLVCRIDLCDEQTLRSAKLLVLPTTDDTSMLHCLEALRRGTPLVVPDADPELAELCRWSNAGLAYADADELHDCLQMLLTDERLRSALGANGHDFVLEQAVQDCARS